MSKESLKCGPASVSENESTKVISDSTTITTRQDSESQKHITKPHGSQGNPLSPSLPTQENHDKNDNRKLISDSTTITAHQDSESLQQAPTHSLKKDTTPVSQVKSQLSPCMTSTPKKKVLDLPGEDEATSDMTLDVLLSSIDEPFNSTENQAENLTSDEDKEDTISKFDSTKTATDTSVKEPRVCELMNDMSNTQMPTQSFSETIQRHVMEANAAAIRKNLFDIPVSPKLKNRVRERLYTLVNSIEGYEDQVYLRGEETSTQLGPYSKIKTSNHTENGVNKYLKSSPGCRSLDISSNQNSFHDLSNVSSLSNTLMDRHGCALTSIMTSQIKALQYQRDELNQEKISLAMQHKEQEANARILLYHEKLQLMIQMVEEIQLRSMKSEAAVREEAKHYEQRMKEREKQHQEELDALKTECRRKIEEVEREARIAQAAANKTCEQRIQEVMSATQVKSIALEKEHQAQMSDMKSTINKLRDLHSKSERDLELQEQTAGESEELRNSVSVLQDKLTQSLNENATLRQILNDCQRREIDLIKKLSVKEEEISSLKAQLKQSDEEFLQEKESYEAQLKECTKHHKQTMLNYQSDIERETSAAVSAALTHHQERTQHLLTNLETHYKVMVTRIHSHYSTQINEYKKAVRCLKERNKMNEKR